MKTWLAAVSLLALLAAATRAEDVADSQASSIPAPENPTNQWSFSTSLYGYIIPDSRDYVNPNFTADRDWLHLEARYNYEALETGSVWVGYNFSAGDKLSFQITPMLGGVFGELTGIAPGYTLSLSYKRLALSSQGEYVFDTGDSSGDFFYTWSELTYSPLEWLRAGLAIQRTKAYQTDFDIQRGVIVGVTYKSVDFAAYVFNLGWTDPTVVLAATFSF
jgi:hypothetical protein